MHKYPEIFKAIEGKDEWHKVHELFEDVMEYIERHDQSAYKKFYAELEDIAYCIPQETAEKLVREMTPHGQNWTFNQVKEFIISKGVKDDYVDWYLVMNMVFNDYYATAKMFGLQKETEFFYSLAKDFIEDPDAKPHKIEKYFMG